MYKIGVLSDTHGLLRPEVAGTLAGNDAIIHAGDIDQPKVLDELKQIAPVYAVRGNADKEDSLRDSLMWNFQENSTRPLTWSRKDTWADGLPESISVTLAGIKIFVIHNKKQITDDLSDQNIVIYGHSHKYHEEYKNGQLWLNPGCCGYRKPSQPITLAILTVENDHNINVHRIDIAAPEIHSSFKNNHEEQPLLPKDINRIIKKAVKEIQKGRSPEEIAHTCRISNELSDLICRMYLTHPGIDMDGMILRLQERIAN